MEQEEKSTVRTLLLFIGGLTALWTLQCALLQNILGYDILEAIVWGEQLALGHAKHPPFSGWVAFAFSKLSGHADWSMYLLAQLCIGCGVWFVYKTARLFYGCREAAVSALLLYFVYYYNPSEIKFSTYYCELALFPAAAFCFFSALEKKKIIYWCLFGLLCGLCVLNKYSCGLYFIALGAVLLSSRSYRSCLRSAGPYIAVLLGIAAASPHLVWLYRHDWVCFSHVHSRMTDEHQWYMPLCVLGIMLYPFGAEALALILTAVFGRKELRKRPARKTLFARFAAMTAIPGLILLAMSLAGSDVILMWLCSFFPWTGAALVAVYPWEITAKSFRAVCALLLIYTGCFFIGSTLDLALNPRTKIHTDPQSIVKPALEFWHRHRKDEIPVVVGGLWLGATVENYSASRPPLCEIEDDVFYERYRKTIDEKGALLIGSKTGEFDDFIRRTGYKQLKFTPVHYWYSTVCGRRDDNVFLLAYYPPRVEREAEANSKP